MATSSSISFSPDLLQQPLKFQRFMSGERDLKNIAEMAKHPEKIVMPSKNNLYFNRWLAEGGPPRSHRRPPKE